jgi:SAM-dependent methyltransferase
MKSKVQLYSGTYKNYADDVYKNIRKEIFREDIGQNSWLTADEFREFLSVLNLSPEKNVLEIAAGSGGPAVFTVRETGCRLTGMDSDENGVDNAGKLAEENGLTDKMTFLQGDASEPLPFPGESFDAVFCIDAINHLKNRGIVLKEFYRVLKKGGRVLYTDPIVVTGILSNQEIAVRSSLGFFLFVPVGENERLLAEAGFQMIRSKDVTQNTVSVSQRWHDAREKRMDDLLKFEEENNYEGIQSFLKMVYTLTSEKRLSRFMFTAQK